MKTDRLLEDIKSRIDIVDFVSDYVQLKKSGQNWKGLCPFHSEKTPSFMVNRSKQIFHCFGCGAGGDLISFTAKYENLSFGEALRMLAKKAGVAIPERRGDARIQQKEEKIRNALSDACLFYSRRLNESETAKGYLGRRGITDESISRFKLGYAPPGWHNLLKHMRNSGYSEETLKDAGLVVQGDRGAYDMFRERVIFPISSAAGNVVAFGGRAFDDGKPKYINSPETAVFKKSETLFGLSLAREAIRHENRVVIVEGYVDVVICHQYGFRNAVAPLGTSLTAGHVHKMKTLAGSAVVVFDGDAAGRAAAKRALSLICQSNYSARVLLLPDGEDPDSYLRRQGTEAFMNLLEDSKTMIEFLLGLSNGKKSDIVREALMLIAQVSDPLVSEEMIVELSDRARMNEATIRAEYRKMKNRESGTPPARGTAVTPARNSEEHLLLSSVLAFPEKAAGVFSRLDIGDIKDKTIASLLRKLSPLGEGKDFSFVLENADDEERMMLTRFSVEPGFDAENVDNNIEDCLRKIERRKLDERLRLAEQSGDLRMINALLREKKKFIEGMKDAG